MLIRAGKRDSLPASPADDPPRKRLHRPTPPQPLPAKALTVHEVLQPDAHRLAIATYYLGELARTNVSQSARVRVNGHMVGALHGLEHILRYEE
eukprot:COSAG01_NODE_5344_length_4322_cov_10.094956_5_plen_94_part_00